MLLLQLPYISLVFRIGVLCFGILLALSSFGQSEEGKIILKKIEATNNSDEKIQYNLELALDYYYHGNLTKAKEHALFAENHIRNYTDKELQGKVYLYKGNFLLELGEYGSALESFQKSYQFYSAPDNNNQMTLVLSSMAVTFERLNNLELALEYNRKVIKIRKELKDTLGLARVYTNMGNIYESLEKYELALNYYIGAMRIDSSYGEIRDLGVDYNNLGFLFEKLGQLEKALEYYQKSLSIDIKNEDLYNQSIVLINMARIHTKRNDLEKAKELANQSLEMGLRSSAPEHLAECYKLMSEIEEKQGNSKASFSYFKQFSHINDSLNENKKELLERELETVLAPNESPKTKSSEWQIVFKDAILFTLTIFLFGVVIVLLVQILRTK